MLNISIYSPAERAAHEREFRRLERNNERMLKQARSVAYFQRRIDRQVQVRAMSADSPAPAAPTGPSIIRPERDERDQPEPAEDDREDRMLAAAFAEEKRRRGALSEKLRALKKGPKGRKVKPCR